MIVEIMPSIAKGVIGAPPSKSMAHRLLICGAISEKSTIKGIEFSEDISATLDCLRSLGTNVEVSGDCVTLGGLCPEKIADAVLPCRESGSTLRFFLPLCLLSDGKKLLKGSERLLERPQDVYKEICTEQGLQFENTRDGILVSGCLNSGEYRVRADISSQFITGLMFALCTKKTDSKITLIGKAESVSYVDLTIKALKDFGIVIEKCPDGYFIRGGQSFASREIAVEGDYSNAAFFDALNLLGGDVTVSGLDENSLQGDRVYKVLFNKLGKCEEIDLSDCPDLAPVLFALSSIKGKTVFTGTRRLKIKESDRATAMQQELSKFGVKLEIEEDKVTVYGGNLSVPTENICGHNDHRIVMAVSLLCTITGGKISGAEAVAKSLPDFFSRLSALNIKLEVYPN